MFAGRVILILAAFVVTACGEKTSSDAPTTTTGLPVWFEDLAARSGLDFTHLSGQVEGRFLMPEIMGGGIALFDADGDGLLDVYCVQSGALGESSATPPTNRLFHNHSTPEALRFEDVTESSGAGDAGYGMGVACGDYDADGDTDLFVTNLTGGVLLRNDGEMRFSDVTAEAGLAYSGWGTSAAFVDYDADGLLDLYVTEYLDWALEGEITCHNAMGRIDYCNPDNYQSPALDNLFHNEGGGRFHDVSTESGIATKTGAGLGVVCSDFDGDGRIDIFVANDSMPDFLWHNLGNGRFEDVARSAGCAVDQFGVSKAGMGVAAVDLDDDGDTDLIVGNIKEQTDSFYLNEGGLFLDRTLASGLGVISRSFTRFGLGFHDFDCDGNLDLFQVNGRVNSEDRPLAADPFAEPNVLMRGAANGRFAELLPRGGVYPEHLRTSRAAAFGDLDNDGGVDVVVVNRDAPADVLRNVVPERGKWIGFTVVDERGSPVAHARVALRADERHVTREVRAESSYQASHDPRIHVGLGRAAEAREIVVTWPDGATERFGNRAAGSYHELRRGTGE